MLKKLLVAATILGLFGTMTNLVYISPLPTLVAALLIPLVYINKESVPRPVFWLLLFTLFTVASVLLYHPRSFLDFGFYRYDGNFFISYLPLLVLPFLSFKFDIGRLLKGFLIFSTCISLIAYIRYKMGNEPAFIGLFVSTNGAGGFYSIVASLALLFFLERKTYTNLALLALNLLFLYATYSRGSMLGLVLGVMCLYFLHTRRTYLITLIFVLLTAVQVYLLFETYPDYKKYVEKGPSKNIYENYNQFVAQKFGSVPTKLNNVYIRMYETWPRAVEGFLQSPLVGTGFGSLNDVPSKHKDVVPHLIATNEQKQKVYNDSHAHHSYLHILGEQGLIGLGLFLVFWMSVYRFLKNNGQHPVIQNFLLISFFNLSIMSFTEHRVTTPSNALPFVIMLGLYFLYVNYQKKQEEAGIDEKSTEATPQ
ncbi:O-antigen ligase family protein [Pontibacter roseus]|uniref:O-antigen ligase family protein n=1 Tax=Pontibacter roseus TaxID=336989 RepID=UPI000382DED9|nr:O-antigen ligase family protein [Pontibacter roseus]